MEENCSNQLIVYSHQMSEHAPTIYGKRRQRSKHCQKLENTSQVDNYGAHFQLFVLLQAKQCLPIEQTNCQRTAAIDPERRKS